MYWNRMSAETENSLYTELQSSLQESSHSSILSITTSLQSSTEKSAQKNEANFDALLPSIRLLSLIHLDRFTEAVNYSDSLPKAPNSSIVFALKCRTRVLISRQMTPFAVRSAIAALCWKSSRINTMLSYLSLGKRALMGKRFSRLAML